MRVHSFGAVLVPALVASGCAQVLGFDDKYDPLPASAGTGGDAGSETGGSSGSAAHAGTSGVAGSTGSAGSSGGGASGTAGDAGASGTSGGGAAGTGGTAGSAGASGNSGASGTGGTGGSAGTSGSSGTSGMAGTGGTGQACDPNGLAIGVVGQPCCPNFPVACNGHGQRVQLTCGNGVWQVLSTCNGDLLCDPSVGGGASCQPVIPACKGQAPGAVVCDGAKLTICGPDLVTAEVQTCASATHCQQSTTQCVTCLQGEFNCNGVQPQVCAPDGMGFVDQGQPCDDVGQCKPDLGICSPLVCTQGSFRCDGNTLEGCDTSVNDWTAGTSCGTGICDATNAQCDVCPAGQITCASTTQQGMCSSDGQAYTTPTCASTTPYCIGQGVCVECTADGQCTPPNSCQTGVCNNGVCDFVQKPDNTVVSTLQANDCKKRVCTSGAPVTVADSTDHPTDTTVCQQHTCQGSTPSSTNAAAGATCEGGKYCDSHGDCNETVPASCILSTGTLTNCGTSGDQDCCASLSVPSATYNRGMDTVGDALSGDSSAPATVSTFHLDAFEVSVGRFRNFVTATEQGWTAPTGSGKHRHLSGGAITNETGWVASWPDPPSDASTWNTVLACDPTSSTWTHPAGQGEAQPINCMTWYEAYAFCIWDNGFLPTEAEWNLAAAGGAEQRAYPWSSPPSDVTIDTAHASYDCLADGSASGVCASTDLLAVGIPTGGDGRYGQHDLAGNVAEWTLDAFTAYPTPCTDCTVPESSSGQQRIVRGGSFSDGADGLRVAVRAHASPTMRTPGRGFRCARP